MPRKAKAKDVASRLNELAKEFYETTREAVWAENPEICLPDDWDVYATTAGVELSFYGGTRLRCPWAKVFDLADTRRRELEEGLTDIDEIFYFLARYEKAVNAARIVLKQFREKAEKYKATHKK